MLFFGKKKKLEEEDQEAPLQKKRQAKIADLYPENSRRRKTPHKPWSKKERYWILFVFVALAGISAVLAAYARSWKLPGIPKLTAPNFSLEQTYVLENPFPSNKPEVNYQDLQKSLEKQTTNLSGIYAFYLIDLQGNQILGFNQDQTMQAASLIKLPVMVALYQESEKGIIDLDEKYSLRQSDKIGGSGSLYNKPAGTFISYRELIHLMGQQSDNTAFNIVRNKLGDDKIQQVAKSIGMLHTSIGDNETSPADVGILFKKLWSETLINKTDTNELLSFLTDTIYEDWIPASIGDDNVRVAHKYGREIHVINDAGIIYTKQPFVLVMMTQGVVETEATSVLPQMIKEIYDYHQRVHS